MATKQTPRKHDTGVLRRLGVRVRDARKRRKLTQAELARTLGFSVAYLSLIERGGRNPPITTVTAVARALRVAPRTLLD